MTQPEARYRRLMTMLHGRLQTGLSSWPRGVRRELFTYIAAWKRIHQPANPRGSLYPPYWLFLPVWVWSHYRDLQGARKVSEALLNTVIWGQYCLFLSVRIHDDLFDRHVTAGPLLFVADKLMLDADRTFATLFDSSSPFWRIRQECFDATVRGIVSVERLQSSPGTKPGRLLREYVRVAGILKVGVAAVCTRAGRLQDFRLLSSFTDSMAVVGQVLDDLDDLEEDLALHRLNYVASFLISRDRTTRAGGATPAQRITRALLSTDAVSMLFQVLRRHLQQAFHSIAPLHLVHAPVYAVSYRHHLAELEARLHRLRVRRFFGSEQVMRRSRRGREFVERGRGKTRG